MSSPVQEGTPPARSVGVRASPSGGRARQTVSGSGIPRSSSRMNVGRNANTQPTYDFLAGGGGTSPPQMEQSLRKSRVAAKADQGNENLRAEIKALQYEMANFKQERELAELRHERELREVQRKAEADFKRAQASESDSHVASHKYEALARELRETQDEAVNRQAVLEKQVRAAQEGAQVLTEELEEARADLSSQERHSKHQLSELETRCATVQRTADELRDGLSESLANLQTTQQRLSQRESEVGQLESEVLRLKAQTGDADTLGVIKHELSEQVAHIKKLEATNRDQAAELKRYRKHHKSLEVVEEEKRVLEGRLRAMDELQRELAEARLQRQILEDERKAWAAYLQDESGAAEFDTPEALAKAIVQERLEKAALIERMGAVEPEISEKDEIVRSLESEKAKLQRELDRLREGGSADTKIRMRLERQRALAEKEVEYLRAQLKTFDAEETTFGQPDGFDEQKAKRIQELEEMVDQYRKEVLMLNAELAKRDGGAPASDSVGPSVKRPREDEPDERLGQLSRKNRKLQNEVSKLQQTSSLLQKELEVARGQVASLQKTSRTRVLELRPNPTAEAAAIKKSTLDALRTENAALLAQLEGQPSTSAVPRATLENARRDLADMQQVVADKEKRMTRLKQIWSAKSLEFREAVASILGYRMDFMPNGRVRVTSMFRLGGAGDGDGEGEAACGIVFDGEQGTMKVAGGPGSAFARELAPLIRFWVEERKDIPCFLAALTLEEYEKTTRAQAI